MMCGHGLRSQGDRLRRLRLGSRCLLQVKVDAYAGDRARVSRMPVPVTVPCVGTVQVTGVEQGRANTVDNKMLQSCRMEMG